jgi:hypothetical protein
MPSRPHKRQVGGSASISGLVKTSANLMKLAVTTLRTFVTNVEPDATGYRSAAGRTVFEGHRTHARSSAFQPQRQGRYATTVIKKLHLFSTISINRRSSVRTTRTRTIGIAHIADKTVSI